jgi:hypothetical protein
MQTHDRSRTRAWLPAALALAGVVLVVASDWNRHDNVSVAWHATASHPESLRYTLHLATAAMLVAIVAVRRPRLEAAWAIAAALFVINTLATSRVVMGQLVHPYTAVAGVEIDGMELPHNTGYYAALLCFRTFSRTERVAEIDGTSLSPPFLPLPVDWTDVDALVPEMTCVPTTTQP